MTTWTYERATDVLTEAVAAARASERALWLSNSTPEQRQAANRADLDAYAKACRMLLQLTEGATR